MAVFMLGVAVGWVATFAIWFAASFSLFASFALGTLIGLITTFALSLLLRWPWSGMVLQKANGLFVSKE